MHLSWYGYTLYVTLQTLTFLPLSTASVIQLSSTNIDDIINNNEFVFVNFYADWCRFSQMLAPVFEETAKKVTAEFPEAGKLVFGKVDCDKETSIAARFHVNKYPTLKSFRNGQMVKREYRGQRSVEAIGNFIREQLKDPLLRVENLDDLDTQENKKRRVIGYFDSEEGADFQSFRKMSSTMRDDCLFYAAIGPVSEKERIAGNKVIFRPPGESPSDLFFNGPISDIQLLKTWTQDKCVPLVREITFENAEELTEEGLPFMILFHNPDDSSTPDNYRSQVAKELLPEKNSVTFLTADGLKFSHPLYHLGKTAQDLPILAIDSFRHMYLWAADPKTDIQKPGLLKQFIADLHSGKLHREFHHGPDPSTTKAPAVETNDEVPANADHVPKEANGDLTKDTTSSKKDLSGAPTSPPESTFKKLAPSRNRYTLLRDEL